MAKLVFRIASDWEEVVKLRNEIAKLKQELKGMDSTQSPATFKTLNTQLFASTQRMDELVTKAAQAGAVMEGDFKRKIFDASQTVNVLSEKITLQRGTIQQLKNELSGLKDKYREALKQDGDTFSLEAKIKFTSSKLREQKDTLFNLTQEQANARLSVKKLRDEYSLYENDGKQVVATNQKIGISLSKALGVIGGVTALKQLGSEIIRVRGEFQSMQTAIETMVGKDMAGQLIPQIKELAKISPLTMSDMVGAEKMMLGFNIQAEDTIKYLKALSDISMGESSKFNSLTLAFSQMSAAGKLMGQDLNQMINAGFNPLQVIAEKSGKSIATLKDEMSKGAISAEMVQQAFIDATSAGGKFFGMSENASKTINGQISMMQDALDNTFNEIGQKSEGIIMKGIQTTTSLIENYETAGKVLTGLIVTYGTYHTAVMLVTAAEAKHTLVEIGLTKVRILARKAQLALNAAMLTNPYVLLATAVVGLGVAMWAFNDSITEAEKAQKRLNESIKESEKGSLSEQRKLAKLKGELSALTVGTSEYNTIKDKIVQGYGKYYDGLDAEITKVGLTESAYRKLTEAINESFASRQYEKFSKEQEGLLDATMADNLAKIQERLYDKLGDEAGAKIYTKIRNGIIQGSIGIGENIFELTGLDKELQDSLDKVAGKDGGLFDVTNRSVEKYISDIIKAKDLTDEMDRKARERFGIDDTSTNSGKGKDAKKTKEEAEKAEKKSSAEWLASYKKAYQDAEKAYKDFLSSKQVMSDAERDKELKRLKGLRDTAKATYESKGGSTSSDSKQDNQSEKFRKEREKYKLLVSKQELERIRTNEDLQMQVDEAYIKSLDEGSKKTLAQIELNFEKEKQAIDRQKEDLLRKKVEDARAAWEANPTNKGKSFNPTSIKLSNDELKYFDDLHQYAITNTKKVYSELANQYLSYRDQRLEIEKKFNDDVTVLQEARKKAMEKGNADEVAKIDRSISKRTEVKNEDMFKLDSDQLKKNMDWEQVFGNLDKVSSDTLKRLKSNLKDFIATQKDLSPENLKELIDAIERIDEKLSERNPFESMSTSFKSLKTATDAEREAQEAYNKALKEGTDEERKNSKATLENAKNNKQKALSEATIALHNGINEIGKYVEAGNQVIDIMEALGLNTPEWLEGTMAGFGEMLNGLGNIDLTKPMSIVTGGLQTIKGALSSITSLGGVINWNASNAKEVQESINRLTERNEALQTSIESLTDEIKASKGTKSVAAYRSAYNYQKEQDANYLNISREQARYHNSHKSWQHYMKWSSDDIRWIQENVNKSFSGTNSLWGLTPEEMEKLRSNVDIWTKMQNAGKGGYGERVTDKLDDYIEQAGKLKELTDALYEGLTGISFGSMYDSFVDNLMDMKYDAKAAAEDISEYFMRAMLSNKIGEMYSDKLENWWKKFGASMEDNDLTEAERNALQDEYMQYVEEAMKLRDGLAAATGYDKISQESTTQSSSKGLSVVASQDSIDETNGRLTAVQMAGEEIKDQSIKQTELLSFIYDKMSILDATNENLPVLSGANIPDIAGQTREIITNSYQSQIHAVFPTDGIKVLADKMSSMERIVDEIRTVQVSGLLESQTVVENTTILAKNSPKILSGVDEIKRDVKNAI